VPDGKYTIAGVIDEEVQPGPQRPPLLIALLIAAVSSVTPSPMIHTNMSTCEIVIYVHIEGMRFDIPFAPKSFTFRKT
jgi:hypothetical protein